MWRFRKVFSNLAGILSFLFSALQLQTNAQLIVDGGFTPSQLANMIAGNGVKVSNVVYTGAADAIGTFDGTLSNIGMSKGILLTTGEIYEAEGPNQFFDATTSNGTPGIAGVTDSYDAAILEFDFVPAGNTIQFRYVFGSEEYDEFVNSGFNDEFDFFISGPGITGQLNMAEVPGLGIPVSIDNINCSTNNTFYVCNEDTFTTPCPLLNCPPDFLSTTVEYDGFTKVLTTKTVSVTPCATYHLRLLIFDMGDDTYDSGVFIEENSLVSGNFTLSMNNPAVCPGTSSVVLTVTPSIGGGTYLWSTGETTQSITVPAPLTTTTTYSATYFAPPCGSPFNVTGEVTVLTTAPVIALAPANPVLCRGNSVLLSASGTSSFSWSPATGLSATTGASVSANPTVTTTYTVTGASGSGCSGADTIVVLVNPNPLLFVTPFVSICRGDSANLLASGAINYSWQPSPGLNTTTGSSVTSSTQFTTTYTVVGFDMNGCSASSESVVSVSHSAVADFSASMISGCEPLEVQFINYSQNGTEYEWIFGDGTASALSNPSHSYISGNYSVTLIAKNIGGCNDTLTRTNFIEVNERPEALFSVNPDVNEEIFLADAIYTFTNLSKNAHSYLWLFGDGNSSTEINPVYRYFQTGQYTVTLTAYSDFGCESSYSLHPLIVTKDNSFWIPNSFSPNNDGVNDRFFVYGGGITDFRIKIFDRWGERIFESNDPLIGWDGTYKGAPLNSGIFVFIIDLKLNDKREFFKGDITLLR